MVKTKKVDVVLFEADGLVSKASQIVRHHTMNPLALKALKSNLERGGYSTAVVSQKEKSLIDFAKEIRSYNPKLVGATATTCEIPATGEVMRMLKDNDNGLVTVIGGYHVSACPETLNLEFAREHGANTSGIDFAVLGEGERTMNELADLFVGGKACSINEINGIAYLDNSGKLIKTAPRERIGNLDELLMTNWSDEELQKNRMNGVIPGLSENENNKVVAIVSERGCPFCCSFCSTQSTYGSQVTMRSAKNLVDEIEGLVDRGVNVICDYAPTANRDSKRVHKFCEEIRKRNLDNSFSMYSLWRLETPNGKPMIDESLVADLTSTLSGLKVGVGIEALSEKDQNYLHKTHSLKHLENVSGWLDKYGALFRGFYMVTPEVTKESLLECETSQVLSKFDDIRVSFLTPFPRTVVGKETINQLTTKDWSKYDCEQPVLKPKYLDKKEFEYAVHDVVQGFLLNLTRRERIEEKSRMHPNLRGLYKEYDNKMANAGFKILKDSI